MNDHECDWWRTREGTFVCACGKSRKPFREIKQEEEDK